MTATSLSLHDAATDTRLAASWARTRLPDPNQTWYREGDSLSNRAWRLHANAAIGAALARCLSLHIVGTGLDLIPQYSSDEAPDSTQDERQARRLIRRALAWASEGTRLDAGSQLTREQLLTQILLGGWFGGGGFAIRTWRDDGTWGTRWRVIDGSRIETPSDLADDRSIIGGIKVDADDRPIGLYIRRRPAPRDLVSPLSAPRSEYQYESWYDEQGEQKVIHYLPLPDRAGTMRATSPMAPILLRARHLDEAAKAHVGGKRQQASLPLAMPSDNPAAAAEKYNEARAAGYVDDAVSVLFFQRGDTPVFPQIAYQGADFKAFAECMVRDICATFGLPWQVVLAQLTDGNMASSQAALDQFERAMTVYQDAFIEQAVRPIDRSILRESQARGGMGLPAATLDRICAGPYRRPRRPDANRLRTRQAASEFIKLGGSFTTAHAEMGTDYEDETRQKASDLAFAKAQGVSPTAPMADAATADQPAEDPNADDQQPGEDQNDPDQVEESQDDQEQQQQSAASARLRRVAIETDEAGNPVSLVYTDA